MTDPYIPIIEFQRQAGLLLARLPDARSDVQARSGELTALVHDAQAHVHRRAAFNARDASCYRLGAAFEPTSGLDLDPVALTGFLALGSTGLLLLVRTALTMPEASVSEQLEALFLSESGAAIRAWGTWSRWSWLSELYVAETVTFLASPAGRDPAARWRRKRPTAEQTYLVAAISLDLGLVQPRFATRGQAFDWIMAQGGNPRFWNEPERPNLAAVIEALRS